MAQWEEFIVLLISIKLFLWILAFLLPADSRRRTFFCLYMYQGHLLGPGSGCEYRQSNQWHQEIPLVFKAGSYGELFICCKMIVKVTSLRIYLLLVLLCDWLKKLTIRPSDKLTWKINCRLWYSLQNPVHTTQCNVEPVCHCSSRLLVSHTSEES